MRTIDSVLSVPFLLVTLLTLLSQPCTSQTISYDYDGAGNRIARRVISLKSSPSKVSSLSPDTLAVTEELGSFSINIYPNPTKGALSVELIGMEKNRGDLRLFLFSNQGSLLQSKELNDGHNPVDMSLLPAGWYILRIQRDEGWKEYKIIKQ